MRLSDLRVLLKHASAMGSVQILHPDYHQMGARLWDLVRWARSEEQFQ